MDAPISRNADRKDLIGDKNKSADCPFGQSALKKKMVLSEKN